MKKTDTTGKNFRPNVAALDHRTAIQVCHECVKAILEGENKDTVASLNTLESINNDSILKYRDLDIYCNDLLKHSKVIADVESKLANQLHQLEAAEAAVDKLLASSMELDQWSQRLVDKWHLH